MTNQDGWSLRRAHPRRLSRGRFTFVQQTWIPRPPGAQRKSKAYRHTCPHCGARIISVKMSKGGWAHFEGTHGLTRIKHPCLHLGEGISKARDDKTGDLFEKTIWRIRG